MVTMRTVDMKGKFCKFCTDILQFKIATAVNFSNWQILCVLWLSPLWWWRGPVWLQWSNLEWQSEINQILEIFLVQKSLSINCKYWKLIDSFCCCCKYVHFWHQIRLRICDISNQSRRLLQLGLITKYIYSTPTIPAQYAQIKRTAICRLSNAFMLRRKNLREFRDWKVVLFPINTSFCEALTHLKTS